MISRVRIHHREKIAKDVYKKIENISKIVVLHSLFMKTLLFDLFSDTQP